MTTSAADFNANHFPVSIVLSASLLSLSFPLKARSAQWHIAWRAHSMVNTRLTLSNLAQINSIPDMCPCWDIVWLSVLSVYLCIYRHMHNFIRTLHSTHKGRHTFPSDGKTSQLMTKNERTTDHEKHMSSIVCWELAAFQTQRDREQVK